MEFQYEYAGKSYPVRIRREGEEFKVDIGEEEVSVTSKEIKPGFFVLKINGKPVKISMAYEGNQRHIFFEGAVYQFTREEGRKKKDDEYETLAPEITSPISGKIVKIDVAENEVVSGGQTLMTIEAMKMEYQINAPYAGTIESIKFKEGDQVEIGMVLVEMNKPEDE